MKYICILLSSIISFARSLNQLSFSGGGSFGAVEIGILKYINQIEPKKYDLYTGISAGALNAGVLSYYNNINTGIKNAEQLYSSIRTRMIYNVAPTGVSLLNTEPLYKTLTDIIQLMPNPPAIHTLIGATNVYSGKLDVFAFEEQNDVNKVLLLMSSSAIPGMFPPITFNNQLYADGGTLSNELIEVEHDNNYLNITFITPYEDIEYDNTPITSLKSMLCRTVKILMSNFNNPMASINENCKLPIGEINKYYIPSEVLYGYNMLDFNKGEELIDIGYHNVIHKKYIIC
ncbi:MAG: patatin-like phospholipase family protein [Flavobacterium sp.]|jgi:predicted patatin/cPLA2 family phospholipase